jgi:putative serine protease PepD
MSLSCGRALVALAVAGALAGCAAPVRLATPAEVRQAEVQQSPTPAAGAGAATPAPAGSPSPAPAPSGSGALAQLQGELRRLVEQVTPSVVQIESSGGLGSGVVTDAQGDVVTNAHVVGSDRSFTVRTSDGSAHPGTLVGTYPANDLAVVRLSGATGLKPADFGDSSAVRVGDIVLTVGSPLGLSDSVSEGIVSGTGRAQSEGNGVTLTELIQITAAISPGNSGGALVDIAGHVIGVPTLGAGAEPRSGPASGIGFAIPSSQVTSVTRQLISGGTVTSTGTPYLGISTSPSSGGGALIGSVVAGGPADAAGVRPGWVVTGLGGRAVSDPSSIGQVLSGLKPGDRVDLTAQLPDGSKRTVTITLGERPANP